MILLEQYPYQPFHQRTPGAINPADVAHAWERWCGDTPWSRIVRRLGELGGLIRWWGGMPHSTLVPLCFDILLPNGHWFPCDSRLKDSRAAVKHLESCQKYFEGPYKRGSYEGFLKAQNEYYKNKEA